MACVCPSCNSKKSQVRDTDSRSFEGSVRRIRQCQQCFRRFETVESAERERVRIAIERLKNEFEKADAEVARVVDRVAFLRECFSEIVK